MEERKGERKETNKKKIVKNQERKHEKQTKNKTESAQDNQRNENKNKANCSLLTSDHLPFLILILVLSLILPAFIRRQSADH